LLGSGEEKQNPVADMLNQVPPSNSGRIHNDLNGIAGCAVVGVCHAHAICSVTSGFTAIPCVSRAPGSIIIVPPPVAVRLSDRPSNCMPAAVPVTVTIGEGETNNVLSESPRRM